MLCRTAAAFVSSAWQWLSLWLGSCLLYDDKEVPSLKPTDALFLTNNRP